MTTRMDNPETLTTMDNGQSRDTDNKNGQSRDTDNKNGQSRDTGNTGRVYKTQDK